MPTRGTPVSLIQQVLAIESPEAVLAVKRLARSERLRVGVPAARRIFRMDPLGPALAGLLLDCSPAKLEPALIEEVVAPVGPASQIMTGAVSAIKRKRSSLSRSPASVA